MYKLWNIFKLNLEECLLCWAEITGITVTITSMVLSIVGFHNYYDILILIGVIALSFVLALIYVLSFKTKRTLYVKGNSKVICRYGDLSKIASKKKSCMIVVPVNDGFDMTLSDPSSGAKPLISPKSIHGQFITYMEKEYNLSSEDICDKVDKYLKERNIEPETVVENTNARSKRYPLGTCAVIKGNDDVLFCLVVVAHTDENNRTYGDKSSLKDSVGKLFDFYGEKGQGYTIYIPLMGTGLSSCNVTLGQSYSIIYSIALIKMDDWCGEVNIVIYDKDKDKIAFNNGIRIK